MMKKWLLTVKFSQNDTREFIISGLTDFYAIMEYNESFGYSGLLLDIQEIK